MLLNEALIMEAALAALVQLRPMAEYYKKKRTQERMAEREP